MHAAGPGLSFYRVLPVPMSTTANKPMFAIPVSYESPVHTGQGAELSRCFIITFACRNAGHRLMAAHVPASYGSDRADLTGAGRKQRTGLTLVLSTESKYMDDVWVKC